MCPSLDAPRFRPLFSLPALACALALASPLAAQFTAPAPVVRWELIRASRFNGWSGAKFGIAVDVAGGQAVIGSNVRVQPLIRLTGLSTWINQPMVTEGAASVAVGTCLALGNPLLDSGRGRVRFFESGFPAATFLGEARDPATSGHNRMFGFAVDTAGDVTVGGMPYGRQALVCHATGVTAALTSGKDLDEEFGRDVAIWANASRRVFRVAVGAPANSENGEFAGAVYLFQRDLDAGGAWEPDGEIRGPTALGKLGLAVEINGDDLIIGGQDRAWVYRRGNAGSWSQRAILEDPAGDGLGHEFAACGGSRAGRRPSATRCAARLRAAGWASSSRPGTRTWAAAWR